MVYADVERYLSLHPGASELEALTREAAADRSGTPPPLEALPAPPEPSLPMPDAPPAPSVPPPGVDERRAKTAVREEFAIRRLAEPDRAEELFQEQIERLRRRYLELRQEPLSNDFLEELERSRQISLQLAEVSHDLRIYAERENDRLFYTRAQLQRRRERAAELRALAEQLRQEDINRLRRLLALPAVPTPEVPPEQLERAQRERDARREQLARELANLEAMEIARVDELRLPAPGVDAVPPPGPDVPVTAGAGREPLASAIRDAEEKPLRPAASGLEAVAPALRSRHEALRQQLLQDLRAAALAAGRAQGWTVVFDRSRAPDHTLDLLPSVRDRLRVSPPQRSRR